MVRRTAELLVGPKAIPMFLQGLRFRIVVLYCFRFPPRKSRKVELVQDRRLRKYFQFRFRERELTRFIYIPT